ncbi:MAG: N-acetyltransferase family protein [Candidatus Binatia bacterium]
MDDFPKTLKIKNKVITLRMMEAVDGPWMLDFAQQLPYHDLMFLRRDITKQAGIDKWVRDIENGVMYTVIAEDEKQVLGYSSLYRNDFDWSRHVAELRVLIAPRARGIGLGRVLTREAFNVALTLGIQKVVARMTLDQTGARTVFEELGFRPEALLRDEVKDRAGKTHDILLMANDVETFLARRDAYGLPSS